jgi:hypothetical protein
VEGRRRWQLAASAPFATARDDSEARDSSGERRVLQSTAGRDVNDRSPRAPDLVTVWVDWWRAGRRPRCRRCCRQTGRLECVDFAARRLSHFNSRWRVISEAARSEASDE